jgi:hypothetical protein
MPNNKNAIIRYQAIDKCLRNPGKNYSITDLVNECNTALKDNFGFFLGYQYI